MLDEWDKIMSSDVYKNSSILFAILLEIKQLFFLFHYQTKAHLDVLADALLRWARGR